MNPQSIPFMLVAGLFLSPAINALSRADEPLQVALVGCAHIHTPGFIDILKRRKDVQVKCVWDHDPARAKKRAEDLGVPAVQDVAAIWADPQIKAVVICSETDRHEELVNAAAKAHKHIYAEKPLGMGGKDAYAMARAIDEAGILFQTGYFMRGDRNILFLKQQIDKGAFGKITRIRGSNCHSGALGGWFDGEWRWMADPKIAGVGAYGDLGTHSLDILIYLMGRVSRVTATISPGTARYPGCDEFGEGILVFNNGVIGTLAAGWDDVANPVSLEVCGTEGHATIVNGKLHCYDKDGKELDAAKLAAELPAALSSPLDRFLDAASGKKDVPLVTPDEAAYRSAVMEALYQSAAEQKWVSVPTGMPGR
jgi:predicted dehydrogenase